MTDDGRAFRFAWANKKRGEAVMLEVAQGRKRRLFSLSYDAGAMRAMKRAEDGAAESD